MGSNNADLNRVVLMADYLNNPQKSLKLIHLGNNYGKASTCHMLLSDLKEADFRIEKLTLPMGIKKMLKVVKNTGIKERCQLI